MEKNRLAIKDFLSKAKDLPVVDVRSPAEYQHAHLPGAISLPLFTDEERKIVGTAYKQQSREAAIKIGLDFFGPKMRKMVEQVEGITGTKQRATGNDCQLPIADLPAGRQGCVLIYCWRGGMRSAAVAWLLSTYGFRVYTLAGGYKSFRNYVLQSFKESYDLKVVGGYTGSGKTEVLQELRRRGAPVVDLEKLANHKGSAFGNINMPPQPTQEMFENLLSCELQALSLEKRPEIQDSNSPLTIDHSLSPIWLEDESQRIGNINIPNAFWESMRIAPLYFLDIPFEERLGHIVEEYGVCEKEKLGDAIQRISKRLGGLETKNALEFLEAGSIRESFGILLHYYDKRYLKGLNNRDQISTLLHKIEAASVSTENASLLQQQKSPSPVASVHPVSL